MGESIADKSPLDKEEVFLIPAFATENKPPKTIENKNIKFVNNEWIYEDIIEPEIEVNDKIKPK